MTEPKRPLTPPSTPTGGVQRDPMDALIRRERKVRRLPLDAACVICGEIDPVVLEQHHIAGVVNESDEKVVMCLNHHRQQSVNQRAAGVDLDGDHQRTVLDRVIAWLRGLGLLFGALAGGCRLMSDRLVTFSGGLDANYPPWRTIPEATDQTPPTLRLPSGPGQSGPETSPRMEPAAEKKGPSADIPDTG